LELRPEIRDSDQKTVGGDVRHTLSCMGCNSSLQRLVMRIISKTRWYHGNNVSSLFSIRARRFYVKARYVSTQLEGKRHRRPGYKDKEKIKERKDNGNL